MQRWRTKTLLHGEACVSRWEYTGLSEQRKVAQKRLRDARILFAGEAWRGCMYIAGYHLECRLKAKLLELYRCSNLKELHEKIGELALSHNLEELMKATGRIAQLRQTRENWYDFSTCLKWKTSWRYDPEDGQEKLAEGFISAVTNIGRFIEHSI
jgi:hypothetical protein